MTGLSIGLYAAQSDIFQELLNVSALSLRFGISVFVWAVGFAPLVQAPFSEYVTLLLQPYFFLIYVTSLPPESMVGDGFIPLLASFIA
jgi:hypothetical protein